MSCNVKNRGEPDAIGTTKGDKGVDRKGNK